MSGFLLLSTCFDRVESPGGDEQRTPGRCALAASIPYWDQPTALRSLQLNDDAIDFASLFWFHLTPDGEIQTYARAATSQALIEEARDRGIKVLALVANLPDDEREGPGLTWDAARVGQVLRPASARQRHARALVALVDRWGFDGVHLDYEALEPDDRDDFTALVAELSALLRARKKLLAVALHNKSSDRDPAEDNGSRAQDWLALSIYADQLHLMTYNQHTNNTRPGPVAAIDWVEPILDYVVELGLPPDKVFVGLPFYAEQWSRASSGRYVGVDRDLTFSDVQRQISAFGGTESWSSRHASPFARFRDSSGRDQLTWFEDSRSIATKLELIRKKRLCNVAAWRLGGEDPRIWPVVRAVRARGGVRE